MFNLFEQVVSWILDFVSNAGYAGIFVAMTLESAGMPIPSEIVLPFAGFLSSTGRFHLTVVITAATLANLTGSLVFYAVGYYGGVPALRKFGRFILIGGEEIKKMENWFDRHGGKVAFFSRILPGVRTYSSLIIGAGKANIWRFIFFTIFGSALWNALWGCLGFYAGIRWDVFGPYVRKFDYLILAAIVIFVIYFIYKHVKRK